MHSDLNNRPCFCRPQSFHAKRSELKFWRPLSLFLFEHTTQIEFIHFRIEFTSNICFVTFHSFSDALWCNLFDNSEYAVLHIQRKITQELILYVSRPKCGKSLTHCPWCIHIYAPKGLFSFQATTISRDTNSAKTQHFGPSRVIRWRRSIYLYHSLNWSQIVFHRIPTP